MFLVVCSSRLAWRSKRARARHSHAALQLDGLGFGWIVGCSLGKIKRPVALKWCASSAKSHRMPGHTHHSLHWSLLYAAVAALLLLQSGFVTHHHTKQTNENEACCSAMVFNAPYFFFSFPVGLVFCRARRFTKSCSSQRLRIACVYARAFRDMRPGSTLGAISSFSMLSLPYQSIKHIQNHTLWTDRLCYP